MLHYYGVQEKNILLLAKAFVSVGEQATKAFRILV